MNKSTHFTGQPTFVQLLKLLPTDLIAKCVFDCNSDHYYKKFNTFHHLGTMLFACYGHCHSLREVVTGMAALEGRLRSSGMIHLPQRTTLADANEGRDSAVFEQIYFSIKPILINFSRTADEARNVFFLLILLSLHCFRRYSKEQACLIRMAVKRVA